MENIMYKPKITKVILNVGGIGDDLAKGYKLLELITKRKPTKTKSKKRIPSFGIRPGLEVGAVVTIRKDYKELLQRLFVAIDKVIKKKQVTDNNLSFGIKEYIEIPGMEYQRDIGIIGFDVTIVFARAGRKVKLRKIKRGRLPAKQRVSKEEIIKFMEDEFQIKFI